MRLQCPNCDATYEVPDSVIPPEGRDVQCSNCGTAWFFNPNPVAAPFEPELDMDARPEPEPEPAPEPAPARPIPGRGQSTDFEPPAAAPPDIPMTEPEARPPQRQRIEPKVADVLREEAAFEAKARAEEAGLEYQDDLPLETPPEPAPPEIDEAAVAAATGSRRALLPDIDEINSTLRATSERKAPGRETARAQSMPDPVVERRKGFRIGFGMTCLALALCAVAYTYASEVSAQIPALSEPLASYVDWVNAQRLRLEDAVGMLVERMDSQ